MSFAWPDSVYAEQFFASERPFLDVGLRQSVGPRVLQLGSMLDQSILDGLDLPFLLKAGFDKSDINQPDTLLDPAFLPFLPDSFSTLVLPHILETHNLPHQVLREAHRVLEPEGHLILTGFNPYSILGFQRFIGSKSAQDGRYYSVRRVVDWLQLLGFEIVTHSMFQYGPLSRRPSVQTAMAFLEPIGARWLPMVGGGYMISAKKRDVSCTFISSTKSGRVRFKKRQQKLVSASVSKAAFDEHVSK